MVRNYRAISAGMDGRLYSLLSVTQHPSPVPTDILKKKN